MEPFDADAVAKTHRPDDDVLLDTGYTWWWFTNEMPRQERIKGNEVRGFSLSCHVTGWLLTVRYLKDGIPQVVFCRKPSPTGCVEVFARKWLGNTLEYFPDKYA